MFAKNYKCQLLNESTDPFFFFRNKQPLGLGQRATDRIEKSESSETQNNTWLVWFWSFVGLVDSKKIIMLTLSFNFFAFFHT